LTCHSFAVPHHRTGATKRCHWCLRPPARGPGRAGAVGMLGRQERRSLIELFAIARPSLDRLCLLDVEPPQGNGSARTALCRWIQPTSDVQHMRGALTPCMPCSFGLLTPPQVRDRRPAQRPPSSDRDCPLDTAGDRCLWHAGGTAGENNAAPHLARRLPTRPQGEARPR
jgi:hypothetical protein